MNGKELYELHKGKRAFSEGMDGVVCGYDEDLSAIGWDPFLLVMAIDKGSESPIIGWTEDDTVFIDYQYMNKGHEFIFIRPEDIIE